MSVYLSWRCDQGVPKDHLRYLGEPRRAPGHLQSVIGLDRTASDGGRYPGQDLHNSFRKRPCGR